MKKQKKRANIFSHGIKLRLVNYPNIFIYIKLQEVVTLS